MKLTVLTENVAGGKLLAEHGLSYFIEHDGYNILFDAGHSDVFLRNARKLNINIASEVDNIVLSHGHWDHGNGLKFLKEGKLITHPKSFMKRFRRKDETNIGLNMTKEEIEERFQLITSTKPHYLNDNIIFLGQIPRLNNFEAQTAAFVDEKGKPDFVLDDSALIFIQDGELIIVTGCSHSGICNIIDYAITVTECDKIKVVIGGLHLKHNNEQTKKTIEYLKSRNVEKVYPSHCTDLPALLAFYAVFKIKQLKTGSILNI